MLPKRAEQFETYLYLQGKYSEVQEQFTTLRNCYYLIECAWCKRRIRWKRQAASVPGDTSHGICPLCAVNLLKKLPATINPAPQSRVQYTRETDASKTVPAV